MGTSCLSFTKHLHQSTLNTTYFIDQNKIPKLDSHYDLGIILCHGEIISLTSRQKYMQKLKRLHHLISNKTLVWHVLTCCSFIWLIHLIQKNPMTSRVNNRRKKDIRPIFLIHHSKVWYSLFYYLLLMTCNKGMTLPATINNELKTSII